MGARSLRGIVNAFPFLARFCGRCSPKNRTEIAGVITAMLDESCGMAVELALDGTRAIATLDLRIDYQKPAIAGLAVARRAAIARNLRTLNRSDCYPFFTNGQAMAERGRNASLPGMISRSL